MLENIALTYSRLSRLPLAASSARCTSACRISVADIGASSWRVEGGASILLGAHDADPAPRSRSRELTGRRRRCARAARTGARVSRAHTAVRASCLFAGLSHGARSRARRGSHTGHFRKGPHAHREIPLRVQVLELA